MDITTRNFFRLLRAGAFGTTEEIEPLSAWKWKRLYQLSLMQGVSALMFDGLMRCNDQFFVQLPDGLKEEWRNTTLHIADKSQSVHNQLPKLLDTFSRLQLRPMLTGTFCMSLNYDKPIHRLTESIDIYFPFQTQGRKADEWGEANGTPTKSKENHIFSYRWNEVDVKHYHQLLRLTNKLHSHALQNIIEKSIRESSPTFLTIDDIRIETLNPTLTALLSLLSISVFVINEGVPLMLLVDLGVYLRKVGDKIDFVQLQEWIDKLHLGRMAQLSAVLMIKLFNFSEDELPFMRAKGSQDLKTVMEELFLLRRSEHNEWYFQQGKDIFVHTANSSAMFWQVRHSAHYFRYYPTESFTNLFAAFAHSLTHIEE